MTPFKFWPRFNHNAHSDKVSKVYKYTKNPNLKKKKKKLGVGVGGGGVDGRTDEDEQAKTNLPLQLLRSRGHNNA